MLHNEAREMVVEGYARTHDAEGIAKAYGISKWTVYHLSEQKRATGSVALRTSQRGRKACISEEEKSRIRECIGHQPDVTIEELREKLGLQAAYSTTARIVHNMGYTVKKKSLHASERERARCAGQTWLLERTLSGHRPEPTRIP